MSSGLNIRPDGALDFLSLGALVHRLDPGVIPFRKATECAIHLSGGEINTPANPAGRFPPHTGIASAMVAYPIAPPIAEAVPGKRGEPLCQRVHEHRVARPDNG